MKKISGTKYLKTHLIFKHSVANPDDIRKLTTENFESVPMAQRDTSISSATGKVLNRSVPMIEEKEASTSMGKRGSQGRKSYTVDFKVNTFRLLDTVRDDNKIKHKTKHGAKEKGLHKSIVTKWEKEREKLFAEYDYNKMNSNAGGMKSIRHRRRLVSNHQKS